jgi:hypothetical protein
VRWILRKLQTQHRSRRLSGSHENSVVCLRQTDLGKPVQRLVNDIDTDFEVINAISTGRELYLAVRVAQINNPDLLCRVFPEIRKNREKHARKLRLAFERIKGVPIVSPDFLVGYLLAAQNKVMQK